MQYMQKLEEEVQRLQDENTAMKAQQKSLEFYVQDSRRYRQIRNQPKTSIWLDLKYYGESIREVQLDELLDNCFKQTQFWKEKAAHLGKPSVELPTQLNKGTNYG